MNGSINRYIRRCRSKLWIAQGGFCKYCHAFVPDNEATVDHIIPRSRGGADDMSNFVMCCDPCNNKKADNVGRFVNVKRNKVRSM